MVDGCKILHQLVNRFSQYNPMTFTVFHTRRCLSQLEMGYNPMNYRYITLYSPAWWFQTCFIFHNIWDVILPIDFHIFQKGSNHQPEPINHSYWTNICTNQSRFSEHRGITL